MSSTSKPSPKLLVAWADSKAARFACKRWHYSKSLPPGTSNIVGVWEDDAFIGVIVFARGASPYLGTPFGLKQTECCELVRIALNTHQTPVSRLMRFAVALLRKRSPGIRLIVSFADTNVGHHGGVYQAGNWVYAGRSAESVAFEDKTGRRWHQRQVSASGFSKEFGERKRCPKRSDMTTIKLEGKHRYLFALDEETRDRVALFSQPYPKRVTPEARARSAESGTPGQPAGRGRGRTDLGAPLKDGPTRASTRPAAGRRAPGPSAGTLESSSSSSGR